MLKWRRSRNDSRRFNGSLNGTWNCVGTTLGVGRPYRDETETVEGHIYYLLLFRTMVELDYSASPVNDLDTNSSHGISVIMNKNSMQSNSLDISASADNFKLFGLMLLSSTIYNNQGLLASMALASISSILPSLHLSVSFGILLIQSLSVSYHKAGDSLDDFLTSSYKYTEEKATQVAEVARFYLITDDLNDKVVLENDESNLRLNLVSAQSSLPFYLFTALAIVSVSVKDMYDF